MCSPKVDSDEWELVNEPDFKASGQKAKGLYHLIFCRGRETSSKLKTQAKQSEISSNAFPNAMTKHSLKAGLFTHKWYL